MVSYNYEGWKDIHTVEDVRQAVQMVAGMAGDPESAHSAEDQLYIAVLKQIADRQIPGGAAAFAAEALLAAELDFPHWYA